MRQFAMDDYDRVYSFWQSIETGISLSASDSREAIAHKLDRDADLFLVAEDDDGIVGTIIGGYDGRRGMIYHLAVAPEHRGAGWGSALLAEVEARLRARGCYKCYLLLLRDTSGARAFYEANGWSDMSGQVMIMGKVLEDDTE